MPTIGAMIRAAREEAGMTLVVLGEAIGISKSHMSLIENSQRSIDEERVIAIEAALGIEDQRLRAAWLWESTPPAVRARLSSLEERDLDSQALAHKLTALATEHASTEKRPRGVLDDLLASGELRRWVNAHQPDNIDGMQPVGRRIPLINSVAAGLPREFTDLDYPASIADEYVSCPDVNDPNAFAARVVGDSMAPEYCEGEVVVFSPNLPTPSGSDCFVRLVRDDEMSFKRIYYDDPQPDDAAEDLIIRLQPLNPAYPPREVRRAEIAAMYRAVYAMRRI
ncbi:MAG: XRE family transcriptional regulator [Phycisphaerales bacterium]